MRLWYANHKIRLKKKRDEKALEKHRTAKAKATGKSESSSSKAKVKQKRKKGLAVRVFLA